MKFIAATAAPAAKELAMRLLPGLLSYVGGDEAKAMEALGKVANALMDDAGAKQVEELREAWAGNRRQDIGDVGDAAKGYKAAVKSRRSRSKPTEGTEDAEGGA